MPTLREPLPYKEYKGISDLEKRVLLFDPSEIYASKHFDKWVKPFKRRNNVSISLAFPSREDKTCSCGCGEKLTGRRTRWATDECRKFAYTVAAIIAGDNDIIRKYLRLYLGYWACCSCGATDIWKEQKNGLIVDCIHVDHIVPVKKGGGGCWLSNYQLLCEDPCHKEKTRNE